MKKHIIGLALFSLIVGITAFIYAMFNVVQVEEVPAPTYYQTYSPTKSCWKMKRNLRESKFDSPKITQAVFNVKTKQLNWELVAPIIDSPIALHFFIKDEHGARYFASEKNIRSLSNRGKLNYTATSSNANGTSKIINITSSYSWLENLSSHENLYVIAEFAPTAKNSGNDFQPEFDAEKATAILVDSSR